MIPFNSWLFFLLPFKLLFLSGVFLKGVAAEKSRQTRSFFFFFQFISVAQLDWKASTVISLCFTMDIHSNFSLPPPSPQSFFPSSEEYVLQ